jgi:hypothetical protein
MINLEKESKLSIEEITTRAKSFFGKGGLGLEIVDESSECLNFTGGGGFVSVVICPTEDKNRVELQTQEWEQPVKQFASKI